MKQNSLKLSELSLSQSRLRDLVHYEPTTGVFTARVWRGGSAPKVGAVLGSKVGDGYIYMRIDGRAYYAHRLAFLYMEGTWPKYEVDHINRIRDDNRWENLRRSCLQLNAQNRPRVCYTEKCPRTGQFLKK